MLIIPGRIIYSQSLCLLTNLSDSPKDDNPNAISLINFIITYNNAQKYLSFSNAKIIIEVFFVTHVWVEYEKDAF